MPRNRYTKAVRKCQSAQKASQEKELATVAVKLGRQVMESSDMSVVNAVKERRSTRLAQRLRDKAKRRVGHVGADAEQK